MLQQSRGFVDDNYVNRWMMDTLRHPLWEDQMNVLGNQINVKVTSSDILCGKYILYWFDNKLIKKEILKQSYKFVTEKFYLLTHPTYIFIDAHIQITTHLNTLCTSLSVYKGDCYNIRPVAPHNNSCFLWSTRQYKYNVAIKGDFPWAGYPGK